MTTYKFCVASDGTLLCYKVGNSFSTCKGEAALKLLNHIKKFSFYDINSTTWKNDNKYTYDMQFISNNHKVTFTDVYKFKNKKEYSIESELDDLFNIVKQNKKVLEQAEAIKNKRRANVLTGVKTVISAATLATMLVFTNKYGIDCKAIDNENIEKTKTTEHDDKNSSKNYAKIKKDTKGTTFIKSKIKSNYEVEITEMSYNSSQIITSPVEEELNNNKTIDIANYEVTSYNDDIDATITLSEESDQSLTDSIQDMVDNYDGQILTQRSGVVDVGPSGGKETYYNLKMDKVVKIMREMGYDELNYPYWVRDDGVKMLGEFVMVAANLDIYPRGSFVSTTLGVGIVCDTGEFAKSNKLQLDIATSW